MTGTFQEHEIRDAVGRMAASATTPALPGAAIIAAGARRRTRRRVGAVGALAVAATLAVSVSVSATSGPSTMSTAAGAPTTTNAFTEQLGRTLEQLLPGTSISVRMFTDENPMTRHSRVDDFTLQITKNGHVTDAFLLLRADPFTASDYRAAMACTDAVPWKTSRSDCTATDLADGVLHADVMRGPGSWTARRAELGTDGSTLTIVSADVSHGATSAYLQVRGGTKSNQSGLTPEMLSSALGDPRFTAYLADFTAHPENDPYGPLAPISKKVVASGTVGSHSWTLSFANIVDRLPGDSITTENPCDHWEYTLDGKTGASMILSYCTTNGTMVRNPPPTDAAHPNAAQAMRPIENGRPGPTVGFMLSSTVLPGTASVEATFDDGPATFTGKVFTVNGDVPYFAVVKSDPDKPAWKFATVRCLDANGKEIGKLHFSTPDWRPAG